MTNKKNLISLSKRTQQKREEIARKGGIKSGEVRREKVELKQRLEILLSSVDKDGRSEADNISIALISEAKKGNPRAYEIIRDTIGQKPVNLTDINPTVGRADLSAFSPEEIKAMALKIVDRDYGAQK